MRIRTPPKRIRERFLIIYELKGCQKAVNFLTEYCGVGKMRIVLDGRRVPRKCCGVYLKSEACFKREPEEACRTARVISSSSGNKKLGDAYWKGRKGSQRLCKGSSQELDCGAVDKGFINGTQEEESNENYS